MKGTVKMSVQIEVITPDEIAKVLGIKDFVPVDYESRHRILGEHLGFDASDILAAIRHVPLCARAQAHTASRKRIAKLIAQGTSEMGAFVREDVPAMVSELLLPGGHDVMAEFVGPCVNKLMSASVGVPLDLGDDTLVSRLFSQAMGISKRRRMNSELAELRRVIAHHLPHLSESEVGDRIALCILGTDALRGTLGCSLKALFEEDANPAEYPRTGVPYIDREALKSCPVNGVEQPANTVVRARLDQFERPEFAGERNRFFGYGAHVCLGRKIAVDLWQQVHDCATRSLANVTVTKYRLRRDDVFNIPEKFEIDVAHA